jgi:phosphohistidine phosphatase
MRLYVMRHGPAEDRSASGRDFDRALTAPGREVVRRMGHALRSAVEAHTAAAGPRPPLRVLSSPRARAQETAAIVRAELVPVPGTVELRDELDGSDAIPRALIAEVASAGPDALLVGHQPVVEELVRALLHPANLSIHGFRTAMIVAIEATARGPFHLAAVLDPPR